MADDVNKPVVKNKSDFQTDYNQGGSFKQKLDEVVKNAGARHGGGVEGEPVRKETPVDVVEEVPTNVEVEKRPEVQGYIEKIEKEVELQKPIIDDYTNQVLLQSAANQQPVVTLPLTEEETQLGLHRQLWESIRWLAEWCVRQVKLVHGKVKYKGNGEEIKNG
jgi:hypothetical protein